MIETVEKEINQYFELIDEKNINFHLIKYEFSFFNEVVINLSQMNEIILETSFLIKKDLMFSKIELVGKLEIIYLVGLVNKNRYEFYLHSFKRRPFMKKLRKFYPLKLRRILIGN
ncbi:MAG: hypothetical protein QM539_10850 [Alphaproteobacteria bacterium]|nr:hypothetical protein [Alphaproteobacteria bacterium]